MYPITSVIETSALQKLCQRNGPNETQQRPRQSNIEVKILPGSQSKNGTKTHHNYAQYINSHGSVGCAGAATYPVKAQETAQKQADVKKHC